MATGRPFEMVVFGASGFTGQYVAEEVARVAAEEEMRGSLRWAVAGRSREKLQAVLERVAAKLGKTELKSEVGIILCDVSDPSSLANMAKQTAVVLNCVGPYRFFGEPVVKACVENGASCVDISGEPQIKGAVFYCNELQQYSIPFMGSDPSVVKRTQRYLHTHLQETPVQYAAYATVGGIGSVIKLMFAGLLFLMLVKFNFGRKLLIKMILWLMLFIFSLLKWQMEGSSFEMTFFGEGYSSGRDPQQGKPDVKICTQVNGPEAGYVATPIAMVQAGVALLKDKSSLPTK
ncbi:hypothetical protein JD844_024938 [Phrynosoma platyrhinos]|uniref:Saccharopine dehydrogenase-like oxidoreductase n=1 Tax=Phrynosoma platyrhinos TaxID=52577 RepID=A0ABQ7SYN4_PHRPL|nr:hypothetical protein JD844_024938 [Phrynosoma platyrhinos]